MAQSADIPPWLWRILEKRGVRSAQDIDYSLSRLIPPSSLYGIEEATKILVEAIECDDKIVIAGDYDVDGASGTALGVMALQAFGCTNVRYNLPNRFEQSYGLDSAVVEKLAQQGCALLITVDNGISSIQAVARARSLGMKIIITDHHLPGKTMPDAHAIINPNQPGCEFPSKHLSGVGVLFYLMLSVRTQLRKKHWFLFRHLREPNMARFLPLVAIGTIADMATLDFNNRLLVHIGLQKIQQRKINAGIYALLQKGGVDPVTCTAKDIGFTLSPPLNAAGRLDSMDVAIECLLCTDYSKAYTYAQTLLQLNSKRKQLQSVALEQAKKMVTEQYGNSLPQLLVLHHADWHQGITGLVAGNIKDMFGVSCIVLARSSADVVKGSGRSGGNIHMRNLMRCIEDAYPGTFLAVGGHAVAVGMTLPTGNIDVLRKYINKHVHQFSEPSVGFSDDGSLAGEYLVLKTASLIEQVSPWGKGFEEPLFCDVFSVGKQAIVAKKHLSLELRKEGITVSAIAFFVDADMWQQQVHKVKIWYNLHVNRFQGQQSVKLIVRQVQQVDTGQDVSSDGLSSAQHLHRD